MSADVIRVLLLDDHTSFRELLALRLAREPDLAVVWRRDRWRRDVRP